MDILYKIIGVRGIGNRICLTIIPVQEGKEFKATKILGNLGGFMEDMKNEAVNSRNPDQISITFDEFETGKYNLGSIISISINIG